VQDKNREISPLEREEGYGGKDLVVVVVGSISSDSSIVACMHYKHSY